MNFMFSDKVGDGNYCTPCYMSPEQCCGKYLRLKSDIWQIGCVLYYLITMGHPFYGQVKIIMLLYYVYFFIYKLVYWI